MTRKTLRFVTAADLLLGLHLPDCHPAVRLLYSCWVIVTAGDRVEVTANMAHNKDP